MEEQDQYLIERFFRDELDAVEQAEFERRTDADADFRAAVETHRKALQAIRLQEKATVMAALGRRGRELDAQKHRAGRKHWWGWASGVLLLLLAFLGWWQWTGRAPALQQGAAPALSEPDSARPNREPQGTRPADTPAVKPPENRPPVALGRETRERLFAAHFKPYKDESLEPSLRSSEPLAPPELFRQLYWDGKFQEALAQFDRLPADARENDNQLFIRAECLLATGKAAEAAAVFERVLKNDRSRYVEAAAWHLALAYLKTDNLEQARARLRRISRDNASPWRAEAAELLKNL